MAEYNLDLSPVFPFPKDLSQNDLRNLGEELRLDLVHFLDKEIKQLNALAVEASPSKQRQELFSMRESMALIRLEPYLDQAGKGRIKVLATTSSLNQQWLENRLLIDFEKVLAKNEGSKKPVSGERSLGAVREYTVPAPSGSNKWLKWLAILPTGISVAILIVLLTWVSDLRSQYEALTESFLLQKEQVMQAVEDGLEKGVEAGKIYDRLKEWVLDEEENADPEAVSELDQIEKTEPE